MQRLISVTGPTVPHVSTYTL